MQQQSRMFSPVAVIPARWIIMIIIMMVAVGGGSEEAEVEEAHL
jgi:hypothetical protein